MLTMKKITKRSIELEPITKLYKSAFPAHERRPLIPLLRDTTGHAETVAFYDGTQFCGFACLLNCDSISHIIYFAIEDCLRGKGYGSAALAVMCISKSEQRVIVDIEAQDVHASNTEQRKKRKKFYLQNGFAQTEVQYEWEGETFEILSHGGTITNRDFTRFWRCLDRASSRLSDY